MPDKKTIGKGKPGKSRPAATYGGIPPVAIPRDPVSREERLLRKFLPLRAIAVRTTVYTSGTRSDEVAFVKPTDNSVEWVSAELATLRLAQVLGEKEDEILLARIPTRLFKPIPPDGLSSITPGEMRILRISAKDWKAQQAPAKPSPPDGRRADGGSDQAHD